MGEHAASIHLKRMKRFCYVSALVTIRFDLVAADGVKSVFFGGKGLCFAQLADRMRAVPSSYNGQNRGEDSYSRP